MTHDQYIMTATGHRFNFNHPEECSVDIEDIAHALSHICRFTGHVREFYSVAQHSVLVSWMVPPQFALQGLLHDAAEAYVGDMSTTLKKLLPQYKEIEHRVEEHVFNALGLPAVLDPSIKAADLRALATEKRDLMPRSTEQWEVLEGVEPFEDKIVALYPEQAKRYFLARYAELMDELIAGATVHA